MEPIVLLSALICVAGILYTFLHPAKLAQRVAKMTMPDWPNPSLGQKGELIVVPFSADKIPTDLRELDLSKQTYTDLLDPVKKEGGVIPWFHQRLFRDIETAGCEVVSQQAPQKLGRRRLVVQGELLNIVRSDNVGKVQFRAHIKFGNKNLLTRIYTATSKADKRMTLGAMLAGDLAVSPTYVGRPSKRSNDLLSEALDMVMADFLTDLRRMLPLATLA